jgi:hypothetical protein
VKRLYADDSAATSVKVGYRQASYLEKAPSGEIRLGLFRFGRNNHATDTQQRVLIWGNERCTMCPFASASNLNEK